MGGVGRQLGRSRQAVEVTPEGLEGVAFFGDLARSANSQPAEKRRGRAPALQRMLQQETCDQGRKRKEFPVHGRPSVTPMGAERRRTYAPLPTSERSPQRP